MTVTAASPAPARTRSLAPDLARGLMLALIAIANSVVYLHAREYGIRQHIVEHDLLNRIVSVISVTLIDGRAYPIFAALFAYGVVQIHRRQRAAGHSEAEAKRILRRRSGWLILYGFAHAVLLFPNDILGLYGLAGLLLVALLRVPDRRLLAAAAWWLIVMSSEVVQPGDGYDPADGGVGSVVVVVQEGGQGGAAGFSLV